MCRSPRAEKYEVTRNFGFMIKPKAAAMEDTCPRRPAESTNSSFRAATGSGAAKCYGSHHANAAASDRASLQPKLSLRPSPLDNRCVTIGAGLCLHTLCS